MAAIGVNIARDGHHSPELIRGLGASWVRIVAMPEHDLRDYFGRLRSAGLKILLVLARESGGDFSLFRDRYTGLVDLVCPGNEPDAAPNSHSSWIMNQSEVASLIREAHKAFPSTPLMYPGLVSGQPSWLAGVDLSLVQAIGVHAYGKSPSREWPHPGWGTGYLGDLLDAYAAYGLPLVMSEIGLSTHEVTEDFQADYLARTFAYAQTRDDVPLVMWFCADDQMVPKFGLLGARGREKPAANAFREQAALAVPSDWPEPVTPLPEPEPRPEPTKPDPWRWWDAPTIAATIRCAESAVREHWPRIVEQLGHCGVYDMPTAAAMLGTVAIETAHRFQPIHEFRNADGSIPAIWHTYDGGPEFHGRGYIQLTHRSNYARYGPLIAELWGTPMVPELDLVAVPDRALDRDISAAVAALYFRDHGGKHGQLIPQAARRGDWREVRRLVQGGSSGLATFTQYASALVAQARHEAPAPVDRRDELIAAYELALRTLRDETVPGLEAQVAELRRIVEQFIGRAA